MLFRSPIVRFFSRILNRVTITAVLVALQLLWLCWVAFAITTGTGRVWVNGLLNALSLLIVLYLVRKDENSAYKVGWIALIGILAPLLAPHDPYVTDILNKFAPYSLEYPLGTDHLGRCVLSRLHLHRHFGFLGKKSHLPCGKHNGQTDSRCYNQCQNSIQDLACLMLHLTTSQPPFLLLYVSGFLCQEVPVEGNFCFFFKIFQ